MNNRNIVSCPSSLGKKCHCRSWEKAPQNIYLTDLQTIYPSIKSWIFRISLKILMIIYIASQGYEYFKLKQPSSEYVFVKRQVVFHDYGLVLSSAI